MSTILEEREPAEEGNANAWMTTFSDLATLLLTFFVLLLSFATLDIQEFREAMGSVREAFGVQFEAPGSIEGVATSPVQLSSAQSSAVVRSPSRQAQLLRAVRRALREAGLEEEVSVSVTGRGVALRVEDQVLFETGSDMLREEARPILEEIARLASLFPEEIQIEGHTDDVPIETPRFPSNWELSTARATSAMRYLTGAGEVAVTRVGVAGYAETRPIAPNDSAGGRAKNRRVEFVFLRAAPPGGGGEPDEEKPRVFLLPFGGQVFGSRGPPQ